MISFPPCKINLGLHILRKRNDGFHELETCFYPVPWNDILEIIPTDEFQFTSSGLTIPGSADDNLCVRAFRLLQRDFTLPTVSIHLHKIVPMGAGLGGGSADGAHTLRLLNSIFKLGLSSEKLMDYAARLGSDCAFFVQDEPMLGTGRGELLTHAHLSLAGKWMILVKPDIHVSTSSAFAGIQPREPVVALTEIIQLPMSSWKELMKNDFERTVLISNPRLGEIKQMMYQRGATYASMSGSGSAIFGIFEKETGWIDDASDIIAWQGWIP